MSRFTDNEMRMIRDTDFYPAKAEIVRKFHPADVEREPELAIFEEISLKSLPQ